MSRVRGGAARLGKGCHGGGDGNQARAVVSLPCPSSSPKPLQLAQAHGNSIRLCGEALTVSRGSSPIPFVLRLSLREAADEVEGERGRANLDDELLLLFGS